jgi:predicted O-methyltransferase YrrM
MWQQWTPEDMLFYVSKAQPGNATSVLEQMDRAAETSWMMNMGSEKGRLIQAIITEKQPTRVLEIGTFLGCVAPPCLVFFCACS